MREHLGGIYDFLQKKQMESLNELNLSKSPVQNSVSPQAAEKKAEAKLSYEQQKELSRRIKKAEKAVAEQQHAVGDLGADALDFFKLLHKILFVVKTSCGIDDKHVCPF